jgi:hypothetical protein
MKTRDVHIVVFCWPRVVDNVLHICGQLRDLPAAKTVLDVSGLPPRVVHSWEWISISPEAHFGWQFAFALRILSRPIFLNIVGDMESDDWGGVVSACVRSFDKVPHLGVWAAEVDNTDWPTERIAIQHIANTDLYTTAQSDCCVWAIHQMVSERLKALDYGPNNIGWGIDWAAVVASYGNGRIVVRDKSVTIHHPPGTGYQIADALTQMTSFLSQLSPSEKALLNIIYRSIGGAPNPSWQGRVLIDLPNVEAPSLDEEPVSTPRTMRPSIKIVDTLSVNPRL